MHVLVTGALGYSGSRIVKDLLNVGYRVTGLINKNSKHDSREYITDDRLVYESVDLSQKFNLPVLVDAIIHTAGRSFSKGINTDELVRDNVIATRNLVSYARSAHVKKFIYFSTISVYGQVNTLVVNEKTPLINPCSYGIAKRICELLIDSDENNFTSVSLRLPAIIGISSSGNWLSNLLESAKSGNKITIANENSYFNNALHLDDLSRFVIKLLNESNNRHETYTLASNNPIKIREVAEMIVSAFESRSIITSYDNGKASFIISSDQAKRMHSFTPMDIKESLHKFIEENFA